MDKDIIILIIEIVSFISISYFIFYKSWLAALGKEIAKLSTIEELTKLEQGVKKDFSEELEKFKVRLNENLGVKMESLKADLNKENITHQIQFGYLHQERAKVILELYKKLIELHSAMMDWTAEIHPVIEEGKEEEEEEERNTRANKALYDFKNFYILNKIFFSQSFCEKIDIVLKGYFDKGWDYGLSRNRLKSEQLTGEYYKHYIEKMRKISEEIKEHFPARIQEIEKLIRDLLKVED